MDTDRLQKILDGYMEKYDVLNNAEHRETQKWASVSHFQRYWDLDAEDFGDMFKNALEDAENVIDFSSFQPVSGIVYLCRQGEDTAEAVRDAFRDLFQADNSDYAARQKRIENFVTEINGMLQETAPDKWKYHQESASALLYLAFADPDDNYLYLENAAKAFADHVGFGQPLTDGERLDLPAYYKMCEELTAEIQQQPDLTQMAADGLSAEADASDDSAVSDIDGEYHILAFDIIYCASAYGLFEDSPEGAARGTGSREDELSHEDKVYQKKKKDLTKKIAKTEKELAGIEYPELTGQPVRHKKYGEGTIILEETPHLTVRFAVGEKKFLLPDALSKGFLQLEAEEPAAVCRRISELLHKKEELERELYLLDIPQGEI